MPAPRFLGTYFEEHQALLWREGVTMEMFDTLVETKIEADGTAQVRTMCEEGDQSEAMREACGMFLTAERKFQKLNSNPDCVTDPKLNLEWWDSLELVYRAEKTVWRLFVGPQPNPASNKLYAKFRALLLKGKSLNADA
jgi:hypothetical protein